TRYAYDNLLYIVAGEIVPRVTGQPWGNFVDERIMQPLEMKRCFAGPVPKGQMKNIAAPHGEVDGQLMVIERSRIGSRPPMSAAAGGIVCSLSDMLIWVKTQLARGMDPAGSPLFSRQRSEEMWTPETWNGVSDRDYELHGTHFSAYGLGWRLRDVHGYLEVSHTGTLAGMLSAVVLIPELDIGVVYLSNGSASDARSAVTLAVTRSFMPVPERDWIATVKETRRLREERRAENNADGLMTITEPAPGAVLENPSRYTGRFTDPWFGEASISLRNGKLFWSAKKSAKLSGEMTYLRDESFLLRWTDRTVEMDAVVQFELDKAGKAQHMRMNRVIEDTERSLDFEDLNFTRID
ncbi:MAG: serine hydrolase, partial [Gammaproteobacteria bacterium]|nr:serine hydrolase [Gammaproteobacteria bacterium]